VGLQVAHIIHLAHMPFLHPEDLPHYITTLACRQLEAMKAIAGRIPFGQESGPFISHWASASGERLP
jgi:hypothetical protein